MNVVVNGLSSFNTKMLLREAALFYGNILLEECVFDKIELDIMIDYDIICSGHCVTEDELEHPRSFTIYINPELTETSVFDTLAHEMVHLKQFANGELFNIMRLNGDELDDVGHIWLGELYYTKPNETICYDAPWEQEAYGKQVGLYHRWQNMKE